jgi:plastocyanin
MAIGRMRIPLPLAAIALALGLAACGTATSSNRPSSSTGRVRVAISDYAYHPSTVTVAAGSTITFDNRDATAHTATSTAPGFDTGTLHPGKQAKIRFAKPGRYAYYCQFHAFMRGVIIVR